MGGVLPTRGEPQNGFGHGAPGFERAEDVTGDSEPVVSATYRDGFAADRTVTLWVVVVVGQSNEVEGVEARRLRCLPRPVRPPHWRLPDESRVGGELEVRRADDS